jgi:hypothetical protein
MPKIFIPAVNEYREIDQVVAIGCSMTHGDELLDSERYPSIPDIEKFKTGFSKINDYYAWKYNNPMPHEIETEISYREGQLSYPAQFAKIYKIPCYNFAESGASIESQIFQFYNAKQSGYITDKTLVIWGLTAMERGFWIQKENKFNYQLNRWVHPEFFKNTDELNDFFYNDLNSYTMLLWKYQLSLNTIFNFAKNFLNDQLIIIQALCAHIDVNQMPDHELQQHYYGDNYNYLKLVYEEIGRTITPLYLSLIHI